MSNLPVEFTTDDAFELMLENEYAARNIDTQNTDIVSYIEQATKWVRDMLNYNEKYNKSTQVQTTTSNTDEQYVNHSGGAIGSDTIWGEIGQ